MARVIYKFGGTSVGDTRRLYRAARRIAAAHRAGDEVVAVLSAQAGATDALLARGREIDPDCAGREADSLLSTGEQVSVSLCALALARLGVPAVSLCGWQMGLQTDGSHGSARVLGLRGDRIERELRAGRVVLAAGFQGVDAAGDITTLGRGGSDTTAVALAAFLHADLCRGPAEAYHHRRCGRISRRRDADAGRGHRHRRHPYRCGRDRRAGRPPARPPSYRSRRGRAS